MYRGHECNQKNVAIVKVEVVYAWGHLDDRRTWRRVPRSVRVLLLVDPWPWAAPALRNTTTLAPNTMERGA